MFDDILDNWKDVEKDPHPLNRRMKCLRDNGVRGMSTENIRFLIHELVAVYAKGGTYFEVGVYCGCSLLSAVLFNDVYGLGVDNFSQFNRNTTNKDIAFKNIKAFNQEWKCEIIDANFEKDFRSVIRNLKDSVDVYFYDGNHSYESQLNGLTCMLPYLSDKCIIIVDDTNWENVYRANSDFIGKNEDFKTLLN
jgi:cephalosporin hydroxylase